MQVSSHAFPASSGPRASFDVLIVGAGQAGGRVAQHLRESGYEGSIAIVGREAYMPYERPPLSKEFLSGERDPASMFLVPENFWFEQRVTVLLGLSVERMDRQARTVHLSDGQCIGYGVLVVATGGQPRLLDVAGSGAGRMMTLRTLDDAERLRAQMTQGRRLVVVGGGVIGLEVASTARKAGLDVDVFEAAGHAMGRILCPIAANWLAEQHRSAGVKLHLGSQLESIEATPAGFEVRARLADGAGYICNADIAVTAIGVNVGQSFLTEAGLGDVDGMPVDARCRSPKDTACYAAGDVARTECGYFGRAQRQETWRNAENQARAVAEFIQGRTEPYVELPWMWTDQHGRNIQVVGAPHESLQAVVRGEPGAGPFSIYWMRGEYVRGGVLVDSGRDRRALEQLVVSARPVRAKLLADPAVPLKSLT